MEALRDGLGRAFQTARSEWSYRFGRELDDFELLRHVDPVLAGAIGGQEELALFQSQLPLNDNQRVVYDLGAGTNPMRGFAILEAPTVVAVDPGYATYENWGQEAVDFEAGVYGGRASKEAFMRTVRYGLKGLSAPARTEGRETLRLSGSRLGQYKEIHLVPQRAAAFLEHISSGTLPNIVLWRAFPSPELMGDIVEALAVGGILITTGTGVDEIGKPIKVYSTEDCTGGADVLNSALPINGRSDLVGLEPLTNAPNTYVYQKVSEISARDVAEQLVANQGPPRMRVRGRRNGLS